MAHHHPTLVRVSNYWVNAQISDFYYWNPKTEKEEFKIGLPFMIRQADGNLHLYSTSLKLDQEKLKSQCEAGNVYRLAKIEHSDQYVPVVYERKEGHE